MNLKITNMQIEIYSREQRMPTLQEFADGLCIDEEIEYVNLKSKALAALEKIEVGENTSIFTKMKEYPYEFEINSSLQLASIDGIKVSQNNLEESKPSNPQLITTITLPNTGSNTRPVGTYFANTNSFTKSNTSEFDKYFSYENESGWTVLKSGYYMINTNITTYYIKEYNDTNSAIKIDDNYITLATASVRALDYKSNVNTTTIYLEKGTKINFRNQVSSGAPAYHSTTFSIYALFK